MRTKLTILLLTFFWVQLSAHVFGQKISLDERNASLETVLRKIEKQSGVTFFYNKREVNLKPVNISVANESLKRTLDILFKNQPFGYEVQDRIIVLKRKEDAKLATEKTVVPSAQGMLNVERVQKRIAGTVRDSLGNPLEGVTVFVKGSSEATTSDKNGNYSIVLPPNETILVFSMVGFEDFEQIVRGESAIDVILKMALGDLDEVVVVGYGTQRRSNVSGSIVTVNFEKEMEGRPIMNASSALAGLAPGLQVLQGSGAPGSDGASLRVRGTTTINNSNPLVLVDGFEADINNINPHDIATISVLKDAASSAIYGSRAANGVILITTKKGSGKPRIQYNAFQSFQEPINMLNLVSDYADHMMFINEGRLNTGKPTIFSDNSIQAWRAAKLDPNGLNEYGVPNYMAYPNTDWFSEIFNTGNAQEHNLSVQGSQRDTRYLISGGFLDNNGIMNDSDLERYQVRANMEINVNSWWTAGTRLFGLQQQKGISDLSRGFEFLWQATPGIYPGEDNKWGVPALTNEESSNANNVFEKMARGGYDKMLRGNVTLFSNFRVIDGLSIEAAINYAPDQGDFATWSIPKGRWDFVENVRVSESALENGEIYNSAFRRKRVTGDLLARYNSTISGRHDIGVLAGYNQQYYNESSFDARKRGMTDWGLRVLGTGVDLQGINGSETDWAIRSVFGRFNYGFQSKYLFEANLRYDESSRFGPDKRGGYFPSFSAAWRMIEEPFLAGARGLFDELKIRASWGQLGNNQMGDYDWQAGYGRANVVIDGIPTVALIKNKLSNSMLHWEATTTSNIGLDFALLRGALSGEFEYYHKMTTGVILTPDNFLTMGTVAAATQNAAELMNRGLELSLRWQDNIGDFRYQIGGNFSYNNNLVTKFRGELHKGWVTGEDGTRTYVNNVGEVSRGGFGGMIVEGRTLGDSYLRSLYQGDGSYNGSGTPDIHAGPIDGMIRTENDLKWVQAMQAAGYTFAPNNNVQQTGLWYGDLIYADTNDDGVYGNENDMNFTGNSSIPKFNFGFQLSAQYKGIDVSMLLSGSSGFTRYWKQIGYNSPRTQNGFALSSSYVNNAYRWDPNNPDDPANNQQGKFPRLLDETEGANGVSSTFWEYDASFVKIRNIQVGYQLPERLSRRVLMERVRIFASGENLFTFTKFPGLDPEIGANVGYPTLKQYAIGFNITF